MGNGSKLGPILAVLAVIGGVGIFAAVSRSFWYMLIGGGPLVVGIVVVCAFLLGVVLGGFLRR